MKATLKTRCGCQKTIDIPFPPNPRIMIPMKSGSVVFQQEDLDKSPHTVRVREFELLYYDGGPNGYADYLEVLQ